MGARGPKPGTGGRPRKPLADKLLDGNPGKRGIYVLKNYTDLEGVDMPDPREYLLDAQKDGKPFAHDPVRTLHLHLRLPGKELPGECDHLAIHHHCPGLHETGEQPVVDDLQHCSGELLDGIWWKDSAG